MAIRWELTSSPRGFAGSSIFLITSICLFPKMLPDHALGYPLADPIFGLLIAVAILVIVWQSGKTVFTRLLDGVDPTLIDEIRNAAGHVEGVQDVAEGRARGVGHPPAAGGKGGGEAKPPGAQRPGV